MTYKRQFMTILQMHDIIEKGDKSCKENLKLLGKQGDREVC